MKKLLVFFIFITSYSYAQYTVKGTLQPANKQTWALLYKIEGAKEVFIKNTQITKESTGSSFTFELPKEAGIGMYRVKYNLQQNGFVDFLFNKENISFTFEPENPERTTVYQESNENKLYHDFLYDLSFAQYKIDSLQVAYLKGPEKKTEEAYEKAIQEIKTIQNQYSDRAQEMLVSHFINATDRYNASKIAKSSQEYLVGVISHFYDNIDFNNDALYNSSFLVDRIADYVFYMHYTQDDTEQLLMYQKACDESISKVEKIGFKADVIEFLIAQFSTLKNVDMVDYLFAKHYDKLPVKLQNTEFKKETMASLVTAIGKIAPNFSWNENGETKNLHDLNDAENYLLIFYSTGCPHCLNELPQVFEFLNDKNKTKVVAFAMEEDETTWVNFIKGFPNWHHALGLKKWENETARTYQINATPTYFVLDKNKKILANPVPLKDLKDVLKQLN